MAFKFRCERLNPWDVSCALPLVSLFAGIIVTVLLWHTASRQEYATAADAFTVNAQGIAINFRNMALNHMQDVRVLAGSLSARSSECACASSYEYFDSICNTLRANSDRYHGGISYAPALHASQRAQAEALLSSDVGVPSRYWRISSDNRSDGQVPDAAATLVADDQVRPYYLPLWYMNTGDVVGRFRFGYMLNALPARQRAFTTAIDTATVRLTGPSVATSFTLRSSVYVSIISPIFVSTRSLGSNVTLKLCATRSLPATKLDSRNFAVPADTAPAGWSSVRRPRGDECDAANSSQALLLHGLPQRLPIWGFANGSSLRSPESVNGNWSGPGWSSSTVSRLIGRVDPAPATETCSSPYADGPARVLGFLNASFIGAIMDTVYMDTLAVATLGSMPELGYMIAAEDVTDMLSDAGCFANSITLSSLPALSFEVSAVYNDGGSYLPRSPGVPGQRFNIPFTFGNVSASPVQDSAGVWILEKPLVMRGQYSLDGSSGFFMFALDTRVRSSRACRGASVVADYLQGGQLRSSSQDCNVIVPAEQYLWHAADTQFTNSFLMTLGGRVWHLQVITARGLNTVPRAVSVSALTAGVLFTSIITLGLFGTWLLQRQRRLHAAVQAEQQAHELTVSYSAHELRNPLFALESTRVMLQDDTKALLHEYRSPLTSAATTQLTEPDMHTSGAGASSGEGARSAMSALTTSGGGGSHGDETVVTSCLTRILDSSDVIARATEQLHAVVNDFVELRKLHRGQLRIQPIVASLVAEVGNTVELIRYAARVPVHAHISRDMPSSLLCDVRRLRQIMDNALMNSSKHTVSGEIDVLVDWILLSSQHSSGSSASCDVSSQISDLLSALPIDAWHRHHPPPQKVSTHGTVSDDCVRSPAVAAVGACDACIPSAVGVGQDEGSGWLRIIITDTGAGLAGRTGSQLFDPTAAFFGSSERGMSCRRPGSVAQEPLAVPDIVQVGTLGLYVAAILATAMHGCVALGEVTLSGRARTLTCFAVTIPMRRASDSVASTSSGSTEAPPAGAEDGGGMHATTSGAVAVLPDHHTPTERTPASSSGAPSSRASTGSLRAAPASVDHALVGASAALRQPDMWQLRVLVVDDDSVNRGIVRRLLTRLGCEVDLLEDGADLVALLSSPGGVAHLQSFHLILLDIIMPRVSGVDACKALRAAGCDRPIVAMTANGSPNDLVVYKAAGFHPLSLIKPFTAQRLQMTLRAVAAPRERGEADRAGMDTDGVATQ